MSSNLDALCNAALIEKGHKRSGEFCGGIIEKPFEFPKVYIYLVSIYDRPITRDNYLNLDPDVRATRGLFTIQYVPKSNKKRRPNCPYLIGQDLVRMRVTVSGPKHWGALASHIPELGWVRRNSTMTDALFRVAKMHPGIPIKFSIDFAKYCDKIERKAKEQGIDINNCPLVVRQGGEEYRKEMNKVTPIINCKEDYESVIYKLEEDIKGEEQL